MNEWTGTRANEIIDATTLDSLTVFDSIDGGAGTDTLKVYASGTSVAAGATVKNVENLQISTTGAGYTLDTTGTAITGVNNIKLASSTAGAISVTADNATTVAIAGTGASSVAVIGGGNTATITTGASTIALGATAVANNYSSVSTTGGTTVAITDRSGASAATGSALKTVSITSAADDSTITANGLTTLNVNKLVGATTVGDVTVTAAAGTRALTVNVNGVDVAGDAAATAGLITIADATATTATLNAVTAKSYDVGFTAGAATTVNVNAAVDLQADAVTAGVATALNLGGAAKITLDAQTLAANAVITSTGAGARTLVTAVAAGQKYVGGDGVDTLTFAATGTTASSLGGGDDVATFSAVAGTGGSVDGGSGTDTVSLTHANAVTLSGATDFEQDISNFEKVSLGAIAASTGLAAADNTTVNLQNLDDINYVVLAGAAAATNAQTNTISGFAANGTFEQTALIAANANVALTMANDTAADTMNLKFVATNGFANAANLTVANVETINITTDDSDTTAATTAFTGRVVAAAAKTVTVSGDAGFNFTNSTISAATLIDGSGITATGVGGALTATAGVAATVKGGAGDDVLVGSSGADTITGGAGADTITTGGGLDTITGGAGADTFIISTPTSGNAYATITDAVAGDKIQFADKGTETFTTTKLALADTAVFQDYLDLAAAGDGSTNGAFKWFQFNGNTYLVQDKAADATFKNGTDIVVKLSGLVDLSTATGGTTNELTLV